jgi:hypothetical protein
MKYIIPLTIFCLLFLASIAIADVSARPQLLNSNDGPMRKLCYGRGPYLTNWNNHGLNTKNCDSDWHKPGTGSHAYGFMGSGRRNRNSSRIFASHNNRSAGRTRCQRENLAGVFVVDFGFAMISNAVGFVLTYELLNISGAELNEIEEAEEHVKEKLEEARKQSEILGPSQIGKLDAKEKYQIAKNLLKIKH